MWRWCEIEALLRHGEIDLARADLAQTEPQVERSPRLRLSWLHARAHLARWEGHGAEAHSLFQQALHLAVTIGLPEEQRQLQQQLATME